MIKLNKLFKKKMSVYASCLNTNGPRGNLGDKFGYILAESVARRPISRLGVKDRGGINENTVALVGSIFHEVVRTPATVYGVGLISSDIKFTVSSKVRILGVRGYYTAEKLGRSNVGPVAISSDPGLLLSDCCRYQSQILNPSKPLGVIVHSVDREKFFAQLPGFRVMLVDNYAPIDEFVGQLVECKAIVSSSLHGIVFSHSFGIPCAPIKVSGRITGGDFKFKDYYSSLGLDIELKALEEIGADVDSFTDYVRSVDQPKPPIIKKIKDKLERDIDYILNKS